MTSTFWFAEPASSSVAPKFDWYVHALPNVCDTGLGTFRGWIDGLLGGSGVGGVTSEAADVSGVPAPQRQARRRSSLPGSVARAVKATGRPAWAITVGVPFTEIAEDRSMVTAGLMFVTVTVNGWQRCESSSKPHTCPVYVPLSP